MLRTLRYSAEGLILIAALVFFRLLPLDFASVLGGVLARALGPLSRAHATARRNLERALPELDISKRNAILSEMWDNLGRVVGEYPHLSRPVMRKRITVEGGEYLDRLRISGEPAIYVSGHFANWEIAPLAASLCALPMVLIYRHANNPVADWLICRLRAGYSSALYQKGAAGARQALRALKEGKSLAMLIDQKMNDGKAVPFFGHDAMTATAAAQMAIKLQVPVLIARVVRTDGAHFHVTLQEPVLYGRDADALEVTQSINRVFEEWIRDRPAQWFWVHNRWNWR